MKAVEKGYKEIIRVLLSSGSNILARNNVSSHTP